MKPPRNMVHLFGKEMPR